MRRTILGAAVVACLLLVSTTRAAEAQGLASLAAASSSATTVEKAKCWVCSVMLGIGVCKAAGGSDASGYCTTTTSYGCRAEGSCASASMVPLDPDGASQSISSEGTLALQREGDPDVRRNCAGVVMARAQSPGAIADVRTRTATLTL